MKKKFLFNSFILFTIIFIFFGIYRFKTSPKKIVASAIYNLDDVFYKKADEFLVGLGISEMIYKMENEGAFTMSLLVDGAGIYDGHRDNLIYIYDPQNDKLEISTFSKKYRSNYSYNLKKINNEIFFKIPTISESTFYFDQNTMNQLSNNSTAFNDLKLSDFDLLNSVDTLNDIKYDFKNYVKKEWNHLLASTKIKELGNNSYELTLKSKDLYSLIDRGIDYVNNRDSLFMLFIPKDTLFKFRNRYRNNREIIVNLKTDINGRLLECESSDGDYRFEINDEFDLKVKEFDLNLKFQKLEDRNSILGRLNNRDFKLTYIPESRRLYYRDDYFYSITEFTKVSKNNFLNSVTKINGTDKYRNVLFNFYTSAKDIKRERDYIEVLKLNQEEWNSIRSDFSGSLDLKRYFR